MASDGALWAWGRGGAWTVSGSDAVRQLGGPLDDLVLTEDGVASTVLVTFRYCAGIFTVRVVAGLSTTRLETVL